MALMPIKLRNAEMLKYQGYTDNLWMRFEAHVCCNQELSLEGGNSRYNFKNEVA